ncbi:hypothetical protein JTB14_014745 [Gonioctena quinquepunctata]|nr:hypothetical protein JTB14_014745 [Gonioctena quinquepunctata]
MSIELIEHSPSDSSFSIDKSDARFWIAHLKSAQFHRAPGVLLAQAATLAFSQEPLHGESVVLLVIADVDEEQRGIVLSTIGQRETSTLLLLKEFIIFTDVLGIIELNCLNRQFTFYTEVCETDSPQNSISDE